MGRRVLISEMADDPEFGQMVKVFLDELPRRIAALQASRAADELGSLTEQVHQLKGAAGGYGFPSITEAAGEVERQLRLGSPERRWRVSFAVLIELCSQAI